MSVLEYYEEVEVVSCGDDPGLVGRRGHVLGISHRDGEVFSYSVMLKHVGECVSFKPHELRGSGRIADERDFYDPRDRIRVAVRDGRGSIIPNNRG